MAQHRQAPSQFKEEPGHDSVSATFLSPESPGCKHADARKATESPIQSPLRIFMANIHSTSSFIKVRIASRKFRHAGDPVLRRAHRLSTRSVPVAARDRDCLSERQTRHCRRWPPGPSHHGLSFFPWTVCRVAASQARGSKSTTLDPGVPEDRHGCRKNEQVRHSGGRVGGNYRG